jgi:hypothetical protein
MAGKGASRRAELALLPFVTLKRFMACGEGEKQRSKLYEKQSATPSLL